MMANFEDGASAHTLKRPAIPNAFNASWEEEFFLVESSGLAKCLIWHKTLQLIKKFNIQRHYSLQHATEYDKYVGNERHKLIQLKENVSQVDNNALSESAMRISYKICHEIANELKTFNKGEFIKRCLMILADELCPQQVGEVEAIRLLVEPCGKNKNNNVLHAIFLWLENESPEHGEEMELIFPVRGHSFLPADRIFGQTEMILRKMPVIVTRDEYNGVYKEIGIVNKLGDN
ncbi:hypothetical protein ANN_11062 [Periplaneta americana]|uniref:Uncharacterized protein n=1 Tax=Periplaneta americana TaxID=6978 RepID=A0ABQ8T5D7_PERAM|nr:hypothetical protein ANN_11062 [Periplaneta americana]